YITQSLELISGITFLLRQLKKNYSLNFRPEKKAYTIRTSDKINIKLQTKIKKEKFSGYVYDLEVEDNHMFVDSCGQILLHNTDSIFVKSKAKSLQEAEKIGKELEIYINNYYDKHIKKEYKRKSFLEMEYEKCYSKFLMPKLRKSEAGAKKRYAGLLKGKLDIVGLEAVRGDWTKLAKEFQEELLEKLFKGEDLEKYIRDFVAKLRKGKLDELLVYTKSLRKPLKDYLKTTPPHVKAARLLDKLESKRIDYVITDEGPEPIQKIKHSIDYEHYINKQLKPLADSILTFFNSDFEDVLKGNKQKSLSSFS
ncbi:MAG: hypothetical protein KKA65_02515, partial [Nanoarchaeota archaeon]|nr:hypothetical protein [Nanoarchaeota archaeon]